MITSKNRAPIAARILSISALGTAGLSCDRTLEQPVEPGAKVMHYDHPIQPTLATAQFSRITGLDYMPFPKGGTSGNVYDVQRTGDSSWKVFGRVWFPQLKDSKYAEWYVEANQVKNVVVYFEFEQSERVER